MQIPLLFLVQPRWSALPCVIRRTRVCLQVQGIYTGVCSTKQGAESSFPRSGRSVNVLACLACSGRSVHVLAGLCMFWQVVCLQVREDARCVCFKTKGKEVDIDSQDNFSN